MVSIHSNRTLTKALSFLLNRTASALPEGHSELINVLEDSKENISVINLLAHYLIGLNSEKNYVLTYLSLKHCHTHGAFCIPKLVAT